MPELRLILLVAGLAVIAGVFFWSRRTESKNLQDKAAPKVRQEPRLSKTPPSLGGALAVDGVRMEPRFDAGFWQQTAWHAPVEADAFADGNKPADDEETVVSVPPRGERKIVALRVVAKLAEGFDGPALGKLLHDEDLRYGKFDIYHRPFKNDANEPVFSVANLQEPGTFCPETLPEQTIRGVSLFMVLPGRQDGVSALADMLATARRIAQQLNGEVQDESGSTLSVQHAAYIRDEIVRFQVQAGVHQQEQHG